MGIEIFYKRLIVFITCGLFYNLISGQNPKTSYGDYSDVVNTITTAVPFLIIAPDSRAGGMGDAGVATTPDANSLHWNPAKYAFIDKDMGVSMSYVPWLRALIDDINLGYLTGYVKIDDKQAIAGSLLYFSLGNITFTNENAQTIGQFNPNEFAIDGAYSRLFGNRISGGVAFRYIYSNLTGGTYVGGLQSKPGRAFASDVSAYYHNKDIVIKSKKTILGAGINISNIGMKISYTDNEDRDFIPINLRMGSSFTVLFDEYNTFSVTADVNKLLTPTPPRYQTDTAGNIVLDGNGKPVIEAGKDPEVAVPVGMYQSFYDAPGGFKEEMREIMYSVGIEYWYANQFALRTGYFHEYATKGNRKYFTVGLGLKLNIFGLDFSYLVPTHQRHPLENTLRFTLIFDFEDLKKQNDNTTPTQ